ncbi:MAG TPA: MarR family transcriptional regulator [Polyangiaceae bacterium]|nr:MarR family transcriptional regulator [Polyangiaceae bacterium]
MTKPSSRMARYVPLVQTFSTRVLVFHQAVGEALGLGATDVKAIQMIVATPMTPTALAERLGLTGAAVTTLVDRLADAGFVKRERDEADRRSVIVRAVPSAAKKLDALNNAYGKATSKLLSSYDEREFETILDWLERTTELLAEHTAAMKQKR